MRKKFLSIIIIAAMTLTNIIPIFAQEPNQEVSEESNQESNQELNQEVSEESNQESEASGIEINDEKPQAQEASELQEISKGINKNLNLNGTTVDYLTKDEDVHKYLITPNKSGTLSLKITSEVKRMIVELYDSDNKRILYESLSGSEATPAKLNWKFGLNPDLYYLKISDDSNYIYTGKFNITTSYKLANNEDIEPNAGTAIANNLNLNSTSTGFLAINDGTDMYRIKPDKSGMLDINITSEISRTIVELYDDNNNRIFNTSIAGSESSPTKLNWYIGLNPNTYYLKISDGSDYHYTGKYSISTSFEYANNEDIEPNGGTAIAQYLPLDKKVVGFIDIVDQFDMYKINVNNKEKITFNFETEVNNSEIELHDDNKNRIFNSYLNGSKNNPDKLSKSLVLDPGTYYISISEPFNSRYSGKYSISANTTRGATIASIEGKDRFETAGIIADKQSYKTAILVNSSKSIADGLSASGLSGVVKAPILYTNQNNIPTSTDKRLKGVNKIYLIGQENAISSGIERTLKSRGIQVVRLGGIDRYETSYKVAKEISKFKKVDKILLTNGYKGEADAINVASVANRDTMPIILTNGNSVPFSTSGVKTYVIGGTAIMSENLRYKTNATRLGGVDRFDTNKKVIQHFYPTAKEFYIANYNNLVDPLVASPISKNAPIVLVSYGSDKAVLKGATKLTRIGSMEQGLQNECLNATKQ